MYRERRITYGTLPTTMSGTVQDLKVMHMTQWAHIKGKTLLTYCLDNIHNEGLVVFATASDLKTLAACGVNLMDGTFKSCPKYFSQLYTSLGYAKLQINITCRWCRPYALLWNKSESTYENLLQRVVQQCNCLGFNFQPATIPTDFEKAATDAVCNVFPNS